MIIIPDLNTKLTREKPLEKYRDSAEKYLNTIFKDLLIKIFLELKSKYGNEYKLIIPIINNLKNGKIVLGKYNGDHEGNALINDILGSVKTNLIDKSLEIYINFYGVLNKTLKNSKLTEDSFLNEYLRIILSVLCHEIAHLTSTEVIDNDIFHAIRNYGEKISEKLGNDILNPIPNIRYYRSGFKVIYGNITQFENINEGITDIIGEELFKLLCEKQIINFSPEDYEKHYLEERNDVSKTLNMMCKLYNSELNKVLEEMKKAYFIGGFELFKFIEKVSKLENELEEN